MVLGPIGRFVSSSLRARGYTVSRPTPIEQQFLRSPWQLFGSDPMRFADVYLQNRRTLKAISQWIEPEVLAHSLWHYGVPEEWMAPQTQQDRTGLNDIEADITTADLIGFLARGIPKLSYLEIGISVGKNILQIAKANPGSSLVGLDVEELNPVLREQFNFCELKWRMQDPYLTPTLKGPKIYKHDSLQSLSDDKINVSFDYLSADQFRAQTWQQLEGRKFNLIYSDGVHSPDALLTELSFLQKFDLIEPTAPFAMVWDDMWNIEMQTPFLESCRVLCTMFGTTEEAISLFVLHGSYGLQHPVGMFYQRGRGNESVGPAA